jgi:bacterioferritin-associated ferredoxin
LESFRAGFAHEWPTRQVENLMYICICNAITERQIVQEAELGARSPEDLAQRLGVGAGCGRCRSCAKALLVEAVARITGSSSNLVPSNEGITM